MKTRTSARLAALAGMFFVLMSYLPLFGSRDTLLNESLIHTAALLVLVTGRAGYYFGLDKFLKFSLWHRRG